MPGIYLKFVSTVCCTGFCSEIEYVSVAMFDDSVMRVLTWKICLELLEKIFAPFKPQIVVTSIVIWFLRGDAETWQSTVKERYKVIRTHVGSSCNEFLSM